MKSKKTKQAVDKQAATKADIENIARLVGRGFSNLENSVNGRFVKLEDKIADFRQEVNVRFNGVDKRIDDLQHQFIRLETYVLQDLAKRVEILEAQRNR